MKNGEKMKNSLKNKTFGGKTYSSEFHALCAFAEARIDCELDVSQTRAALEAQNEGAGFCDHLLEIQSDLDFTQEINDLLC